MKKYLFLIPALFFASMIFGQAKDRPFAQFGIKAGVNLANVKSELYPNSSNRTGFHAGLLAHIHLNRRLAIQPEIMYSQEGFEQQVTSNLNLDMRLDYVNVPVLVQYMYRGFRVETGPKVGFMIDSEASFSDGRTNEMEEFLSTVDFSWVFGASYLSPFGVGVHARYNLGINNINENVAVPGVTNNNIQNRVWQFGIFYQFPR